MAKLVTDYNRATQSLIFLCTGPLVALMFFGYPILRVWTSPEAASQAAPILTLLAPGFLLGMTVAIDTTLATASGHTGIIIRRNLVALVLYLPLLYVAITRWAAIGAAAVWLVINLSFLCTQLPWVQRHIIGGSTRHWLERNLLPFLVIGVLTFGGGRALLAIAGWQSAAATAIVGIVAAAVYGVCGLRFLSPDLRNQLWIMLGRLNRKPRAAR